MNSNVRLDSSKLTAFCHRWRIRELSVFGSALRDDFGPESDLDFLVSLEPDAGWNLCNLVEMREELKAIAGREVDIVMREALRNPCRRREILTHRPVIHAA